MGVHSPSVAPTPRLVKCESENLAASAVEQLEQLRATGEVRHKLRKSESSYDPELTEWLAAAGVLAPSGAAAAIKALVAETPARAASLESGCVGQVEPEPACVACVAAVAAPGCEAGAKGGAFSSWAGPRIAILHVPEPTSHEIFMSFVRVLPCGAVDGSGILSPECYQRWLETRAARLSHEAECFRKSLIAKVTRTDCGSAAFPPAVEAALLVLLRKRQVWPCFKGKLDPLTGRPIKIGTKGLRSLGFHEREQLEADEAGHKVSSDCCVAKRKAQCSPIAEEPSESDSDGDAPKRRRTDT
jgi:hypothetical protein